MQVIVVFQLCDTFFWRAYAPLCESYIASGTTVGELNPRYPRVVVLFKLILQSISVNRKIERGGGKAGPS